VRELEMWRPEPARPASTGSKEAKKQKKSPAQGGAFEQAVRVWR
jgi:hypothetical protein